jgi:ATP-dependent RNA helicase DDX18/HAS1
VAIKKVTNVFSKKILAKRALREIKLLQHFRGMYITIPLHPVLCHVLTLHRSQKRRTAPRVHMLKLDANPGAQITCLYDMDIPRPDNFNEAYLYEGTTRLRLVA